MYFKIFISSEKKIYPCELYDKNCWIIKILPNKTKVLETYTLKSEDKVLLGLDFEDVIIYDGDKIEIENDNKKSIYDVEYKSGKFIFVPNNNKNILLESFDIFDPKKYYNIKILGNKYEMN